MTSNGKIKPEDIDRLFIAVNASSKGKSDNKINPDKQLCRYEFLEILIRIAIKYYCENGEIESEGDAVDLLWNEFLNPHQ